ncbi:hypothetical protein RO3G_08334 [Rhizopus delemar RA 99-880]|uniref:Uncharacterized protein n=1 Tax=Rhizopus delemar (strain RA 99-880 / ATCC MYA-4621 / FGSC 9543 / NRRL 43880) TaxID=246409 RepID=I1C599_RHIO9|nr:hypothetical protein RO3G_08334 [Rhizopus delemar RA 99-880]|eukprot:EIE83629.1 hypothetical protein RO3G_08334 [Rhizopus delemar RA 99-880]
MALDKVDRHPKHLERFVRPSLDSITCCRENDSTAIELQNIHSTDLAKRVTNEETLMMPESKEELKVKCQVMLLSVIVLFFRSLTSRADHPRVWWRVWWQKRSNFLERTVIGDGITCRIRELMVLV